MRSACSRTSVATRSATCWSACRCHGAWLFRIARPARTTSLEMVRVRSGGERRHGCGISCSSSSWPDSRSPAPRRVFADRRAWRRGADQDARSLAARIEVAAPVAVTSMHVLRKSTRLSLTNLKAGRACLAATSQAETEVALIATSPDSSPTIRAASGRPAR